MFETEKLLQAVCTEYCKFYDKHEVGKDPPMEETETCKDCPITYMWSEFQNIKNNFTKERRQ